MAIDIGRIVYKAFCDEVNNDLPTWEELGFEQRYWRAAACAVLRYMDQCEEELKNNPDVEV